MTRAISDPLAPNGKELRQLLSQRLHDPHGVLGVHPVPGHPGTWVLRAFHPDATGAVALLHEAGAAPMRLLHKSGLFAALLEGHAHPPSYQLRFQFADGSEFERGDPYRFLPTLGDLDLHLIGEGSHQKLWEVLGAHPRVMAGVAGVAFAVWAPNAGRVNLVGNFNAWDGRLHPMRPLGGSGVWELFIPDLAEWAIYRYEIVARDGALSLKTDPLAFTCELRPKTAGLVFNHERYAWNDGDWLKARAGRNLRQEPFAVYEVHLGSWMRTEGEGGGWLTYREIAPRLAEHVRRLGFTHVELLPVA
ncbi:MAG: 1,4-alpha-glucan branching enzyme, partial [Legionella sp.]|nr:1,4-alpha-glucan branching enzyme [Legionella sp.]